MTSVATQTDLSCRNLLREGLMEDPVASITPTKQSAPPQLSIGVKKEFSEEAVTTPLKQAPPLIIPGAPKKPRLTRSLAFSYPRNDMSSFEEMFGSINTSHSVDANEDSFQSNKPICGKGALYYNKRTKKYETLVQKLKRERYNEKRRLAYQKKHGVKPRNFKRNVIIQ